MTIFNQDYRQYLNSQAWREVRQRRLQHDCFQCARCDAKERLEVHHLTYDRVGAERLEDLLTLCRGCHAKDHGRDPMLPAELPDSFFRERFFARERMLIEQENIAEAAGVDLTAWDAGA